MYEKLLEVLTMKITIKELITEADERFPDWRGPEKETWVTNFSYTWLERFDNVIPVVGAYLDIPVCDTLEKSAVQEVIKSIYDEMNEVVPVMTVKPVEG